MVSEKFLLIPVPGHTEGSTTLLYNQRFLFTGDHIWWDRNIKGLGTPEQLLWDEKILLESIHKLLTYSFEWVLPGHGDRIQLTGPEMTRHLEQLLKRRRTMKTNFG